MLFNSLEYALLLIACVGLFWSLATYRSARVALLLAASYFFYASWNAKYLLLILFSSTLDFVLAKGLSNTNSPTKRKVLLLTSIVVNLGILCTFKYFNFFSTEMAAALGALGINVTPWHLDVLLPVGISFYTFQTLSYTVDVFRKKMKPAERYFDYLLFVSFFPQLVAGPIVRASHLLPQIEDRPKITARQGSASLYRIALGLLKKALIADYLGAQIVDPVFGNPEMYTSIETIVAAYAYAFQIYADFSAYSDIAIGSAGLLGFKIPENFNTPYKAANLREFWQRWHISLSTWLRDYLYIPLGGSKKGSLHTYKNLTITMLLGGLWHGAALTFVAWGALHSGALVVTRIVQRSGLSSHFSPRIRRFIGVFLTFHLVVVAWIFFRSPSFAVAGQVFDSLVFGGWTATNIPTGVWFVLAVAAVTHFLPSGLFGLTAIIQTKSSDESDKQKEDGYGLPWGWGEAIQSRFHTLPAILQAAALIGAIVGAHLIAQTDVAPFIYFQF